MLTKYFTDRFKTYKISLACSDYISGNQLIFLKTVFFYNFKIKQMMPI